MTPFLYRNPIFSLLLLPLFFSFSYGQTSSNQTAETVNSTNKTKPNLKIVRPLGTKFENVVCQILDKEGNVWFSINGEGAYRFDGRTFTNFTLKNGLCDNNISAIIQDKAGNILFGTNKGICKYDGKRFTNLPKTDTLNITSLLEDREGNLWFGVINKGIYRYDGKSLSNVLYKYKHPFYGDKYEKYISDIIQDRNGNIWFSSWNGGGVWKYDGKNFKNYLPSLDYYKTNQDKRRIGNNQNSSFLIPENYTFIQSENYISDDMIFSITEDKAGNIWFATRNHGACRYDPSAPHRAGGKKFTGFGNKEGFLSSNAYAILEDKKGNLWFTTEKDGVWCYDGKIFKNFNEKNGLINNAVMSALEDKEGNIWFGTKWMGLSRYDGKTFKTFSQNDK